MRIDKKTAAFILAVLNKPMIVSEFKAEYREAEADKIDNAIWQLKRTLEDYSTDKRYDTDFSTVAENAEHVTKRLSRSSDTRGGRRPYFDKMQDDNEEGLRRSMENDLLINTLI